MLVAIGAAVAVLTGIGAGLGIVHWQRQPLFTVSLSVC